MAVFAEQVTEGIGRTGCPLQHIIIFEDSKNVLGVMKIIAKNAIS